MISINVTSKTDLVIKVLLTDCLNLASASGP